MPAPLDELEALRRGAVLRDVGQHRLRRIVSIARKDRGQLDQRARGQLLRSGCRLGLMPLDQGKRGNRAHQLGQRALSGQPRRCSLVGINEKRIRAPHLSRRRIAIHDHLHVRVTDARIRDDLRNRFAVFALFHGHASAHERGIELDALELVFGCRSQRHLQGCQLRRLRQKLDVCHQRLANGRQHLRLPKAKRQCIRRCCASTDKDHAGHCEPHAGRQCRKFHGGSLV